jgi:hypothetical protein
MAVGDVWQVNFFQVIHGNPVMSRVHYQELTGPATPQFAAADLADEFRTTVADILATILSEDWSGTSVQIGRVSPGPINPYTLVLAGGSAVVGAVVSEAVPSNAPLVVTKYTSSPTKRGRGRWFQSGIPESYQDCGQLLAANIASIQAAFDTFLTQLTGPLSGAVWGSVVWSPAPLPSLANDITSMTLRTNLANMRPRRSPPGTV